MNEITDIQGLADFIRDTWAKEYEIFMLSKRGHRVKFRDSPQWSGGINSMGRKSESIWLKAANMCADNEINPEELVKAQFLSVESVKEPPFPNTLVSENGYRRLMDYESNLANQLGSALEIQTNQFIAGVSEHRHDYHVSTDKAYQFVLTDESIFMSPLFRYCMCCWLRDKTQDPEDIQTYSEIISYWELPAISQYLQFREKYNSLWKEFISPNLKEITTRDDNEN